MLESEKSIGTEVSIENNPPSTSKNLDRETVVLWNQWLVNSPYKKLVLTLSNVIGPQLIYVIALALLVLALIGGDWDPFFHFLGALLLGVVVFMPIKFGIRRRRPFLKDTRVTRLDPHTHKTSFPSGHSFWVSLILLFVAVFFGAPWWVAILLYDLSIAISLFRITLGAHYPTDIMMGHFLAPICLAVYFWLFDAWYIAQVHYLIDLVF
jgi:membrane-associated phospholipid phosphatase